MSVVDSAVYGSAIVAEAESWLGVPYLYGGGRGSLAQARTQGVDCSGLVYQVFSSLGIDPGTDTVSQFNSPQAQSVPDLAQAQPGDLIFFGSPVGGTQEHVGIYMGNGLMIDAPHTGATVRIDQVAGWNEPLLGIKRIAAGPVLTGAMNPGDPANTGGWSPASSGGSSISGLTRLVIEIVAVGAGLALIVAGVYQATKSEPKGDK